MTGNTLLAEVGVCWVEEPGAVSGTDLTRHGLARAGGEHDYDPADQLQTLADDVQIWQPDPTWCGGLAHTLSMVELAALLGIRSLPHGSGLALALAASAPADAVPAIEYHLTLDRCAKTISSSRWFPSPVSLQPARSRG